MNTDAPGHQCIRPDVNVFFLHLLYVSTDNGVKYCSNITMDQPYYPKEYNPATSLSSRNRVASGFLSPSVSLDTYNNNRSNHKKRKARHTFPNEMDDKPVYQTRRRKTLTLDIENQRIIVSESDRGKTTLSIENAIPKYTSEDYPRSRMRHGTPRHKRIHPVPTDEYLPNDEPNDENVYIKINIRSIIRCFAVIGTKLLCLFGVVSCVI